jgi:hypothetical protein
MDSKGDDQLLTPIGRSTPMDGLGHGLAIAES